MQNDWKRFQSKDLAILLNKDSKEEKLPAPFYGSARELFFMG
jgi:hypothetical protein